MNNILSKNVKILNNNVSNGTLDVWYMLINGDLICSKYFHTNYSVWFDELVHGIQHIEAIVSPLFNEMMVYPHLAPSQYLNFLRLV